ncbi:hypothetical protein H0194_08770 [Corynebacterium incognita]|uniref:Uncharacterized protein n=1 Tax=Corynebacterium incognita TaxID=2754725 RepID=A0A7G7CNH8_9CORY|nr:hypothetical protein [Corynebacterium incognita]QNE89144.1 hypothetical protein H0194_08770 [Corynebacterium incognita]
MTSPTTVARRRKQYLSFFYLGLIFIGTALPFNLSNQSLSMTFWVLGIGISAGCVMGLQKTLRPSQLKPELADEYELVQLSAARAKALNVFLFGTLALMMVLLCVPLLEFAGLDATSWAEVARTCGMATGGLVMLASFVQLRHLALETNKDIEAEDRELQKEEVA